MNVKSFLNKFTNSCEKKVNVINNEIVADDITIDEATNNEVETIEKISDNENETTKDNKQNQLNTECDCYDCCGSCNCCGCNSECSIREGDCSNIVAFANLLNLPANFCPCSTVDWSNLKISIKPCLHCLLEPCIVKDAHLVFDDPCGEPHDIENYVAKLKRVRIVGCIQYIISAQSTVSSAGGGASVSEFYTVCVDRVVEFIDDCYIKACSITVDYQNLGLDSPPEVVYGNNHALRIKGDFVLNVGYIQNPSFEHKFKGWNQNVPVGATIETVTQFGTYTPREGCYFALLKTDGPGSYTSISQTFTAKEGDTIEGCAFFKTNDYMPYNDNCQIEIKSGSTVIATPFSESVAIVGNYGQTPWKHWSYTFTTGGTFTIKIKIANDLDSILDSYIGVDAIHLIPA